MIYPYGSLKFPTPFSDTVVDNISEQDGRVDTFAPIDFSLTDKRLIENINQRINDAKEYYDDHTGFNLSAKRSENLRMYLGLQVNPADYYESEEPYIENQIRGAVESITAYATARTPQSTVTPANDSPEAKKFAANMEKVHMAHSLEHDLRGLDEIAVRSWLLNQAAYLMLEFDPSYGDDGEIIPSIIPCDELVVDKNAKFGQNPEFITIFEKHTVEELVYLFPEMKTKIFESQGIERVGKKNMTYEIVTRKTWFTYYAKGKPEEAVCIYYDDVMLGKYQDINWLHGRKNFLRAPMKPIIPLNVISDGKHWVDFSSILDDGIHMQRLLNNRGKQISRNADSSNGTTVINAKTSGLTKEDASNWTQGPDQKLYLKKAKDGVPLEQMVSQLPGRDVKQFIVEDKQDMRGTLAQVMAVPLDQTGADSGSDDPTLGQSLIKKNNMNARQDMIVRALDRFHYLYFNFLTQMMFVWYNENHYFPTLDSDGSFERIVVKRYYFDEGMTIGVKASSTIAFDKNREQAMALHFLDQKGISHLDAYRIAGFDNYQKLYDNWVKENRDPYELVKDIDQSMDNGDAYAEFVEFMGGKTPKMKKNADKDYILTLRKKMIDDLYLEAKPKIQIAFANRVSAYIKSFELRESLDQLGQEDIQKVAPGQPIPPPMPEQQFQQMMQPQPMGMPPQMPGQMPPGAPQMPPGMPPGVPSNPGLFNGTPIQNPAHPAFSSSMSAVPTL